MEKDLQTLQELIGLHYMGVDPQLQKPGIARNINLAMDAQPDMITVSNSGIPAFMSTFVDPKLIEVLIAPMKAADIAGGEIKKGDFTTETTMFQMVESTGQVASYGDFNNDGSANANVNFPQRQSYHYQVVTQWGEKELARAALAKIDWANRLSIASVLTLNKYQNKTYFYGVSGLKLYGLLNDPNLTAAITPTTKTAGGTGWTNATALEILADVAKLFTQLQTQANGLVDLDSPMTLCMSPLTNSEMTKTTQYNVNVMDLIKKNYPNLTIKTAPEYTTDSGELVQMILDNFEGQKTVDMAFTEKLRAHPIVVDMSGFKQKKSQGTWGAIIYRPVFIAQMLGV